MLVLARRATEHVSIGKTRLLVRRVYPSIDLSWTAPGFSEDYSFQISDLSCHPVIRFAGIRVILLAVKAKGIVLGIDAHPDVKVLRGELMDRDAEIEAETTAAD